MNLKIIGIALAVVQILIAVWYFDWHSTNQMLLSGALGLSGASNLLLETESEKLKSTRRFLRNAALVCAVVLLLKMLVFD